MAKGDDFILETSKKIMISDETIVEAIRDIYKEEIKEVIRKKLKSNPRLEKEMKEALADYTKSKLLEASAQGKILKVIAELGLISIPETFRDDMVKSILKTIGPELDTIIKNTL